MNNNVKKGSFPVSLVVFVILAFLVGTLMGSCTKEFLKHNGYNVFPRRSPHPGKYLLRNYYTNNRENCFVKCKNDAKCGGFTVSNKVPNRCQLMRVNRPDGRHVPGATFFGKH